MLPAPFRAGVKLAVWSAVPMTDPAERLAAESVQTGDAEDSPARHAPPPGTMLGGKYRVEHVLGFGGMGLVVAATHVTLDERFAIKLLLPAVSDNVDIVARFLREGRAAIKIRGEHVVRIHDVDTLDSGTPFMVMEYLAGSDLEAVVTKEGPMEIARAVDIVLQASEAIAEAHALGIVHRDLKPANLFLTHRTDGTPAIKVLDFGISKVVPKVPRESRITGTAAVLGSPHYMSPEQLLSTRDVDARTDIWALGVILHELLTGAVPFPGATMPEVCANVLKEAPAPLRTLRADVPERLEQVVLTCLEKDLSRRFDNVGALAAALAPFGGESSHRSAERIERVLYLTGADTHVEHAPAVALPVAEAHTDARSPGTGGGLAASLPRRRSAFPAVIVSMLAVTLALGGITYQRMQQSAPVSATDVPTSNATLTRAVEPALPPDMPAASAAALPVAPVVAAVPTAPAVLGSTAAVGRPVLPSEKVGGAPKTAPAAPPPGRAPRGNLPADAPLPSFDIPVPEVPSLSLPEQAPLIPGATATAQSRVPPPPPTATVSAPEAPSFDKGPEGIIDPLAGQK